METKSLILYLALTALTCNGVRILPMLLIHGKIHNQFVRSFLYYVPYVTLAVMTFPAIIQATQDPIAGIVALVLGIVAAWRGWNLFSVSILCCISVFVIESRTCLMAQTVQIARWQGNAAAAVTYTFDDGLQEDYTVVWPALKERGLVGTFCVIGSKVGLDQKGTPCCTWEQLKEMSESGMEIASHGYRHQNVEKLDSLGIVAEVAMNDSAIEQNLGHKPETYCFPGNRKTELACRIIEQNHVGCRLFQTSLGSKRDSLWMTNWLHDAIAQGIWIVGMTHGIRVGYDHFATEEAVQAWYQHLDEAAALQRTGQLWVATLTDVLKYQRERDASTVTVTPRGDSLCLHLSCPLDSTVYTLPLTVLVTLADGTNRCVQVAPSADCLIPLP